MTPKRWNATVLKVWLPRATGRATKLASPSLCARIREFANGGKLDKTARKRPWRRAMMYQWPLGQAVNLSRQVISPMVAWMIPCEENALESKERS
jgi:hypothetical protein